MSKLPAPTGWHVLVKLIKKENKTKGGLYLPEETQKANEITCFVGEVMALGPIAYADSNKFGNRPWCQVGDLVSFGQYNGQRVQIRNDEGEPEEYRVINDDDVIMNQCDPESIVFYA